MPMKRVPGGPAGDPSQEPQVRRLATRPTGEERLLPAGQVIVTKTDPRGLITYANEVFLRISSYTEDEVLGEPHNLVRHPDMPRCVFKLLWDTLKAGDEIFAYVVNLASDGAHYWVFAHVTPSYDAQGRLVGYHSNRRPPARSAIAAASELYTRMRAAENAAGSTPEALAAGERALHAALAEHDVSYDQFVWSVTPEA
jgi:PAS domain S-box-containing protein